MVKLPEGIQNPWRRLAIFVDRSDPQVPATSCCARASALITTAIVRGHGHTASLRLRNLGAGSWRSPKEDLCFGFLARFLDEW